ncbi:ABC transporter ATP-binding protein [Nonomuraea longicatena]|uniref:ABC transporter ATP-binding protein n=1 Tax=Nonomuraea longicatena TaxID=83682 RepID=A0ABP4AIW6_9ACTN
MEPVVRLERVRHEFPGVPGVLALDDVDLAAPPGRITALLGPSGCGKTTILRVIAGYLRPGGGRVLLNGRDATALPPERRDIGMVFQSYALFPHLTAAANVAFGLRMRRLRGEHLRRRVRESLDLVGLADLAARRPHELSGGQRQRVALARAVAIRPAVLLLDEPLSNLDARLAVQMRGELRRVQRETGLTAVLVTHDQEEALELADEIAILDKGRVMQHGTPEEVFRAPASRWIADFLGYQNFLDLPGKGLVTVRPEHIGVLRPGDRLPPDAVVLAGTVSDLRFRGTGYAVTVETDESGPVVVLRADAGLAPGTAIRLSVPLARAVGLDGRAP